MRNRLREFLIASSRQVAQKWVLIMNKNKYRLTGVIVIFCAVYSVLIFWNKTNMKTVLTEVCKELLLQTGVPSYAYIKNVDNDDFTFFENVINDICPINEYLMQMKIQERFTLRRMALHREIRRRIRKILPVNLPKMLRMCKSQLSGQTGRYHCRKILQMRHSRITVRKMQTHRHSREKMRMPARLFQEIR